MIGTEIFTGDIDAPEDPELGRSFHQRLVDFLIAGARDCAWPGAVFSRYSRQDGRVTIGIAPGSVWPGLEELRQFRERNREERPLVAAPEEQGSLL